MDSIFQRLINRWAKPVQPPGGRTILNQPQTLTFPMTGVGDANDWLSTSGNKVTDVKYLSDGHYIYLLSDSIPEIVKFSINLEGLTITSPGYNAPENPAVLEVDFASAVAPPGNVAWDFDKFSAFQCEFADNTFDQMQGFTTRVPEPLVPWNFVAAGIRATIQFGAVLDQIRLRVLKAEKLLIHQPD